MDGKEILEHAVKAAKSVGMDIEFDSESGKAYDSSSCDWSPRDDSSAALTLAVKLKMCVDHGFECAFANTTIPAEDEFTPSIHVEAVRDYSTHSGDALAATRCAIFLAAAEVGRQL